MVGRKIKCDGHGNQWGYLICRCILDKGNPVEMVFQPKNDDDLGQILCVRGGNDHSVDELTLICRKCARERNFISKRGTHPGKFLQA